MDGLQQITYADLLQWEQAGKMFQLIDVREQWERDRFHIGGTHVPMSEIFNSTHRVRNDVPVVFYCEKGIRSVLVIQRLLVKMQLQNLYNLSGGIQTLKSATGTKLFAG